MGAYIDQAYLEASLPDGELVRLTETDGNATIDAARVAAAIARAEAIADAHLAVVMAVPPNPVDEALKGWVADLARFELYDQPLEFVRENRGAALRKLEQVAAGKLLLKNQRETSYTGSGDIEAIKTVDDRLFTSDTLANF